VNEQQRSGKTEPSAQQEPIKTEAEKSVPVSNPGLLQVTLSVMAAAIGVQSRSNREKDFSQSSPLPYILGGLIFTVLFVSTLIFIVSLIVG